MDQALDLTGHWTGLTALAVFVIAYGAVVAEEQLHLRKSQPVMLAAGIVWVLAGIGYAQFGQSTLVEEAARHNILEFAELFLFLLAAMTYVNTMEERGVFNSLRAWLVGRGYSLRTLFWVTGLLAFAISPIADNLTTALLMGAVCIALGEGRPRFVTLSCINVVVAANAGGAFSPFGDITTLMVWQAGKVDFFEFFALFLPSVVNWLVPAAIMSMVVENTQPQPLAERPVLEAGSVTVVCLFIATIALTVTMHNSLHLPPALGMMAGLGVLKMYSYFFNVLTARGHSDDGVNVMDDVFATPALLDEGEHEMASVAASPKAPKPLDIFKRLEQVEWDTLMFFFGVLLCVGGLGAMGYLRVASSFLYGTLGTTAANVLIGGLSAVIDNVPVMFAVLSMDPTMSHGQWLLVTLTAGVGGSLLSVGSAAGVALMGQARGIYTFGSHLRWAWTIALGYAASIGAHLLLNRQMM